MKKLILSLMMLPCVAAVMAQDPTIHVSDDGYYLVGNLQQFEDAVKNDLVESTSTSKIRLVDDLYLSDLSEGTFANTFSGEIDGNYHTIWAARPEVQHDGRGLAHGKYLFVYSDGATFRNLTFKDFRADTQEHSNWAILTSQARNQCVFENITFDHVSVFGHYNNVGAAAGYAYDCTFTNIEVLNSDFTVDDNYVGALVGDADKCTFTSIEVNSCESTADDDEAGGVVGHSVNCTFNNVDIKNSFIKVNGQFAGGVAGTAKDSHFTSCVTDDQTCVCSDGFWEDAFAGGIAGDADHCDLHYCINSALIAVDDNYAGGIVSRATNKSLIESCLNTGMVLSLDMSDVVNSFYNEYKTESLECVTKSYLGKEYKIRKDSFDYGYDWYMGGIAGKISDCTISKCTNFGSIARGVCNYAGGIVGIASGGTIIDCLADFPIHPKTSTFAILGYPEDTPEIINCLNTTIVGDYLTGWGGVNMRNVYSYRQGTLNDEELTSGMLCYKLGSNWEQNLGTDSCPIPSGNRGLYHTRTVSGEFGTICLPYVLQSNDDVEYFTFSSAEDEEGGVTLNFTSTNVVDPGTPALFRVREAGTCSFDDASVAYMFDTREPEDAPWTMHGTFKKQVFEGEAAKNIYYVSNDVIKHAQNVTIEPYRAYFSGPSIEKLGSNDGSRAVRIVIDGEEDNESGLQLVIDDVDPYRQSNKSYTLFGTEAGEGYRGIMIRNGKKVISNVR